MQTQTLFLSVAAGIVAMMAAAIYFKHREHRRRQAASQTDSVTLHVRLGAKPAEPQAPASSEIGPDHPWYGLWCHLFKWRNFSESELQQIVGHCDYILCAKAHKEAVFKWESLMGELLGEDSIESVREAINEIKGKQEKAEQEAAAWRRVAFKNIGADTVGQADKAMAALVDGHRDFEKRFKEQMELRQAEEAKVLLLQQGKYITECERDEARALAKDLKECLDRSLLVINDKDEQIRQLLPVEFRKHSLRNPDGTFKRKVDAGMTQRPAPTPVKHLREENEQQAKKPRPISSVVKEKYAIELNTPEEEAAILKLFKEAKVLWSSVKDATEQTHSTPYCISAHRGVLTMHIRKYWEQEGFTILPASDFLPAEHHEPIEPRPDHPCLKGCSKPGECECPESAPKDGLVEVWHSRKDLIVMGCNLTQSPNTLDEDKLLIDAWAKEIGLVLLHSKDNGHSFNFTRPAVNSDFDVANTNA